MTLKEEIMDSCHEKQPPPLVTTLSVVILMVLAMPIAVVMWLPKKIWRKLDEAVQRWDI